MIDNKVNKYIKVDEKFNLKGIFKSKKEKTPFDKEIYENPLAVMLAYRFAIENDLAADMNNIDFDDIERYKAHYKNFLDKYDTAKKDLPAYLKELDEIMKDIKSDIKDILDGKSI